MKINLAYKTELDLNNQQKSMVNQAAGGARFTYNWGLDRRIKLYESEKKVTNAINQHKELNKLKKTDYNWMYNSSKCVFQEALRDLDKGFKNFFRNIKQGKKAGFPKFKSKHNAKQSFRLTGSIHVFNDKVQLPRLGKLRLKEKGYIPTDEKILSATVSKHCNKYFVSISVEKDVEISLNASTEIIGVDLGIKDLAITSDDIHFENPKTYKRFLKKLKRQQRWFSRKTKGSNNRRKQKDKVAKIHYKISNIRKDNIHKMTSQVVKTKPQTIVIEDLSARNMMKNHKLAQSIADSSFGEIRRQFEYKTKWNNIQLVIANRWFPSSKLCSNCGHKKEELKLSERVYVCESCGVEIDRDLNAAINLKLYTVSSTGINASGEDKVHASNSRWSSLKEEFNIKTRELVTC